MSTPRTDAATFTIAAYPDSVHPFEVHVEREKGDSLVDSSFARALETELDKAQSQLKEALEKGERLEEENDELRTKIKSHEDWIKGPPSTGSSNWSALAEKEGGKS